MARPRRRLRDPGPRRGAGGGDRGRLLERGRAAGPRAAAAVPRSASTEPRTLQGFRVCSRSRVAWPVYTSAAPAGALAARPPGAGARGTVRRLSSRLNREWASSPTSPAWAAATWPSTSAPPTRSSTCAAAASCSPSRPWWRSTRARPRCTRWGSRPSACSGRTPGTIQAIRPLKDGVIADFDVTEQMLRHFIQKVHQNRWAHPRVVVCVPCGRDRGGEARGRGGLPVAPARARPT